MMFYHDQSLEYHDSDRLAGMMIGMACIVLALGTPRLRQLALNGFHDHHVGRPDHDIGIVWSISILLKRN